MEQLQPDFNPQIQEPCAYIIPDLYQFSENSVQNKKKTSILDRHPLPLQGKSEDQLPF